METADKVIQFLREKSFLKEILYLSLGLFLVFLINVFFSPNIDLIPNYQSITPSQRIIFLFVVAYFLCRISHEIGISLTKIVFFLLRRDKKRIFLKFFSEFKENLNSETYYPSVKKRYFSEVIEEFSDSNYIRSRFEETDIRLTIGSSFLGFSLVLIIITLFTEPRISEIYFFILFIFSLINSCCKFYSKKDLIKILADISSRRRKVQN